MLSGTSRNSRARTVPVRTLAIPGEESTVTPRRPISDHCLSCDKARGLPQHPWEGGGGGMGELANQPDPTTHPESWKYQADFRNTNFSGGPQTPPPAPSPRPRGGVAGGHLTKQWRGRDTHWPPLPLTFHQLNQDYSVRVCPCAHIQRLVLRGLWTAGASKVKVTHEELWALCQGVSAC